MQVGQWEGEYCAVNAPQIPLPFHSQTIKENHPFGWLSLFHELCQVWCDFMLPDYLDSRFKILPEDDSDCGDFEVSPPDTNLCEPTLFIALFMHMCVCV